MSRLLIVLGLGRRDICPTFRRLRMSAVDETIVREYFEAHGFLVCQRRKYVVQSRQKTADEEINLIVLNARASGTSAFADFEVSSKNLGQISRAIVAVKGWHTEVFAPGVLA